MQTGNDDCLPAKVCRKLRFGEPFALSRVESRTAIVATAHRSSNGRGLTVVATKIGPRKWGMSEPAHSASAEARTRAAFRPG